MSNKNLIISGIIAFFGILFAIMIFKTKGFHLKKEIVEDFQNFYIEKQLEQGIMFEPITEVEEESENEEVIEYVVKYGDSLESIFASFEFASTDYRAVINLLSEKFKKMKIFAGQKLDISYTTIVKYSPFVQTEDEIMPSLESKNQTNIFKSLSFQTKEEVVEVVKKDGIFEINIVPFEKAKRLKFATVKITSSLYQNGIDAGLSPNLLENLIRLYSFDVDFQRDVREGDEFEVFYEEIYDEKTGKKLAYGNILFAKINLTKSASRSFEYYLFKGDYYNQKGEASAKSFLKTPVPGARLTSKFGNRKHPILGFTRLHAGIDFAAPRGTPVFSAANGTIEFIGWNGGPKVGYGKLIIIRHNSTYQTAYAHLNGFRSGLQKGSKVRQGEVIGYVGSTGYSTGPHLHYEVIKDGVKINPTKATSFVSKTLAKKDIPEFLEAKEQIIQQINEISR
jgi:murein DD-endopeptidase MepM/ murein hydrolase activator NlpD